MKRTIYKVNTFEKILPLMGTKISSFYAGTFFTQTTPISEPVRSYYHISIQMDQSDPLYLEI
jgi:hypothetical protein